MDSLYSEIKGLEGDEDSAGVLSIIEDLENYYKDILEKAVSEGINVDSDIYKDLIEREQNIKDIKATIIESIEKMKREYIVNLSFGSCSA